MRADRILISVIAVLMLAVPALIIEVSDAESPASVTVGAAEYTVMFDTNSGSQAMIDVTSLTTVGQKISELPTPVWKDHTFKGWHTADGQRVAEDKVYTEDTTLYAQWSEPPERYKVGSIDFSNSNVLVITAIIIVVLLICVFAVLASMGRRKHK